MDNARPVSFMSENKCRVSKVCSGKTGAETAEQSQVFYRPHLSIMVITAAQKRGRLLFILQLIIKTFTHYIISIYLDELAIV